jgi:predicted nucleic acid-binding protein
LKYWDASALVPLLVNESRSLDAKSLLAQDNDIVTWSLSHVEVVSAIERRARDGTVSSSVRIGLIGKAHRMFQGIHQVEDLVRVQSGCFSLLARYPLRSADAQQLSAALILANGQPQAVDFVCFDDRLADAASREGFIVLG